AIKTVSEKDLQNLANISGPNVTIEDWMVGLGRCGKECLKDIQTFAPKSDSPVDRVPPLMLSRCMRGGKTTFLVYLFELVKAEPGYLPIFISFNGFFGIQRKRGESRLQTILRAIAVTLLPATPTDTQSVSCDEDTLCDHLERQNGIIVLMIDELNLLVPKGTTDNEVASFLRRVFLSRENRYLVFTTHEPFDGSQIAEYTGGKYSCVAPQLEAAVQLPSQGDAKWILCYAAQMCSYLNQLELADWINRLQTDASDPLSGKGWEVLVVLAVAFRCLEAMARGHAGHPLLGLPPKPNIQECYFWDVPPEVSTLDEALEWWARQDIPPTFPFVAVLNPLCSTFEMFDCILLYQRQELGVRHVRGFQQKAGRTYPDKAARQDVDSVWMQGKAAENRRSEQALNWTLPSAGEIREFLGASLRDLFPKELDT
ncbi:blh, partial [Symbiodinium necroappetens]